jgi:hypothetical protein
MYLVRDLNLIQSGTLESESLAITICYPIDDFFWFAHRPVVDHKIKKLI